ncbi:hypothetical protein [Kitasatospora sp. A2-31]|nr:hypothetical protein [Kitasatospora sp. A2-31]
MPIVTAGKQVNVLWPLDGQGRYDVVVTAGTGRRSARRYAGRVH